MNNAGHKLGIVRYYVTAKHMNISGTVTYGFSAIGCDHVLTRKAFPCAKWADHTALDFSFADPDIKQHVARHHKTKKILSELRNVTVLIDENLMSDHSLSEQPSKNSATPPNQSL